MFKRKYQLLYIDINYRFMGGQSKNSIFSTCSCINFLIPRIIAHTEFPLESSSSTYPLQIPSYTLPSTHVTRALFCHNKCQNHRQLYHTFQNQLLQLFPFRNRKFVILFAFLTKNILGKNHDHAQRQQDNSHRPVERFGRSLVRKF